ncbi:MAG TPA: LysR family transcriptional regulator [Epulopiscium sp.]|nr:LysR family transcriptional regulator [Candidatus Epulonipiscium sp.]
MVNRLGLYKIFTEVVEYENFSKAAKALYMTQPAVSQAIMQLEEKLGIRLFTRTSRGVMVTNEGKLLYEYISSAINLIDAGEQKIRDSKSLMMGDLQIGVGDTISRYYLLPYLEIFHNKYPNIKLKIINRTTPELATMLKSGKVDIAICNLPLKDPAFIVAKCMDVHDIFVCGEQYKDKIPEFLSLQELVKWPLILLEKNSNSRLYVEKYMLSKGLKMNPEIELGSHDLLLEFAKINLGIACVTQEFCGEYLQDGRLYKIKLDNEIPKRSIGYCFLKSVSLSPASTKFLEILTHTNKGELN